MDILQNDCSELIKLIWSWKTKIRNYPRLEGDKYNIILEYILIQKKNNWKDSWWIFNKFCKSSL